MPGHTMEILPSTHCRGDDGISPAIRRVRGTMRGYMAIGSDMSGSPFLPSRHARTERSCYRLATEHMRALQGASVVEGDSAAGGRQRGRLNSTAVAPVFNVKIPVHGRGRRRRPPPPQRCTTSRAPRLGCDFDGLGTCPFIAGQPGADDAD